MAARRLKSDRFFTNDLRPGYTQVGYDWVYNTTMKDVLLRHYPELEPAIGDLQTSVFAPWPKLGAARPGKKRAVIRLADTVRAYMP